jgi:hypothetical protein
VSDRKDSKDEPATLPYASRSTPGEAKLPGARLNRLDWVQITIVAIVLLVLVVWFWRGRRTPWF